MVDRHMGSCSHRRLLIISRLFAPCLGVGAQRAIKLARRIREFGWEPYVLTASEHCQYPSHPRVGADVLEQTIVRRVPCWSPWLHLDGKEDSSKGWGQIYRQAERCFLKLTQPLLPLDAAYPWVLAATGLGVRMVHQLGIDLIWATSPPLPSVYLARAVGKRTGTPYIADFRDVITGKGVGWRSGRQRRSLQWMRAVIHDAAGVTYVSPGQRPLLRRICPQFEQMPNRLAYNWFEPWQVNGAPAVPLERPTIFHGGGLYGGWRRVSGFLEALMLLRRRGDPRLRVNFLQHGMENDMSFLRRDAERHGATEAVRVGGALPYAEFQRVCRAADALLLVVGRDADDGQHAGAIPGKLYDYIAACRPILVIGPPGCEAGKIVSRLNRGITAVDDDPQRIARGIQLLLENRGDNGPLDLTIQGAGEFEASSMLRGLAEFFESVLTVSRRHS